MGGGARRWCANASAHGSVTRGGRNQRGRRSRDARDAVAVRRGVGAEAAGAARSVAGTAGYVAERFVEAHSEDGRVGRRRRQRRREQSAQGDAHLEARRVCGWQRAVSRRPAAGAEATTRDSQCWRRTMPGSLARGIGGGGGAGESIRGDAPVGGGGDGDGGGGGGLPSGARRGPQSIQSCPR